MYGFQKFIKYFFLSKFACTCSLLFIQYLLQNQKKDRRIKENILTQIEKNRKRKKMIERRKINKETKKKNRRKKGKTKRQTKRKEKSKME